MADTVETAPLHSIQAEEMILGAILWGDANTIASVSTKLTPEDFYLEPHREVFEAFLECRRQNYPVGLSSIVTWLEDHGRLENAGGEDYIKDLMRDHYPVPQMVENSIAIVRDRALKRKIREAISDIIGSLQDDEKTYDQVIAEATERLYQIQREAQQGSETTETLAAEMKRIFAEIVHEQGEPRIGPLSGYRALDEILKGFRKEQLIILAARPSVGKTTLAINLAVRIAQSLKRSHPENSPGVAFYTMEMSPNDLAIRFFSMLARIDSQRLFSGNLSNEERESFIHALSEAEALPIYLDGTAALRPELLKNKLVQQQLKKPIHLVIVDYLQLMSGDKSRDNRVQEVSEISKKLKQIAREQKVCILALSQLSREIEKRPSRRPVLSDLRESGSIEQDADVVMFLYSDEPDFVSIDEAVRDFQRRVRTSDSEQVKISIRSFIKFNPEKMSRDEFDHHLSELTGQILQLKGEIDDSEEETVPVPGSGPIGNETHPQYVIVRFKIPQTHLLNLKEFINRSKLELDFVLSRHLVRVKLLVEKNRYGPKGEVPLWFRRDYGEFREEGE